MYCLNPNDDEPIFSLFDQIGCDEENPTAPFVDGGQFAKELLYMDGQGKKRIKMYINCEGGLTKEGFSIAGVMRSMKTPVTVRVLHAAESMGAVIAMMAPDIEAMDFSKFMLHMAYATDGSESEGLDMINKCLVMAVSKRWGKSEEETRKALAAETYFTAAEAKKAGLIDRVISSAGDAQIVAQTKKERKDYAVAYLNKTIQKENTMEKSAICDLLGLDHNVSDAVAMDALRAFKAKADKVMVKAKKAKAMEEEEEEDCSPEMKALKKENAEMKAKMEASEKAKNDMETADKKAKAVAKAKSTIEAKAKERGLKFEDKVLTKYVALAGDTDEGLTDVIETIEAIEVTKTAPATFEIKAQSDGLKVYNAATIMSEVRNRTKIKS